MLAKPGDLGRVIEAVRKTEGPRAYPGSPLIAADGRVEFNNQVATRLLRRQSEVRKTIQDEIWKNESSGR